MTSGDGVALGTKGYNSVKGLVTDVKDGNVLAAGKDAWDLGGLAKDVSDFAGGRSGALMGDPLAALIEAGLDFLLDLVAPLKDALDLVTGDPEGLTGKAEEWSAIAESLRQLGPAVSQDAARTQGSWQGAAGDAFRAKVANFERGVASVAGQADHVADVLRLSATLMDAAQGIIKGIIASWVEYAILTEAAAAASAVFTFGASEAAGQAAVAGEAAVACGEGADTVGQAASMLERVASEISRLEGEFSQLGRAVQEEASAMRGAEGALRSASDMFAQASRQAASEAVRQGVEDTIKDAGLNAAVGVGDDAIKAAQAQSQDGHESQSQIDHDLTVRRQ
jgi:uncharacterized protein YukE